MIPPARFLLKKPGIYPGKKGEESMPENTQSQKVKEITDRLETGIQELFNSEQYRTWLRTMSKFHSYSLNNTLLIAFQMPEATLVAGYTAWQKQFGRQVLKGEKGIKILAPTPFKKKLEMEKLDEKTQQPILDENGDPVTEQQEILIPAFKVVNVFDVSQTEGRELPTIGVDELSGTVEQYEQMFAALKRSCPVPVDFENIESGAKGYYHQLEQRIALQEGMSQIQTIKTLIHEMAHQKLHAMPPALLASETEEKSRSAKEVEAESVAFTVCSHFGIDASDYSFAYIAGWSKDRSAPELKASLGLIRNASSEMITLIEEKLLEVQKEREQAAEKAIREQIPEREYGPEHRALMEELIRDGADVRELWLGGKPVDLTAMDLSAAEVADLRYRMEVEAIPRMRFSKEQWDQIQAGIREQLDVKIYADPDFTPEQMQELLKALRSEQHGFITRDELLQMASKDFSAEEIRDIHRELRRERSAVMDAAEAGRTENAGLQENGRYRYWSTQRPVGPGTFPKTEGKPVAIENFDARMVVEGGRTQAWGYLEYEKPLDEKQVRDYELKPALGVKQQDREQEPREKRQRKSVLENLHDKQKQVAKRSGQGNQKKRSKEAESI